MTQEAMDKMIERIQTMAEHTWQAIGPDAIEILGPHYTLEDQVEMVMDADRMEMFGGDPEAFGYYKNMFDHPVQVRLVTSGLRGY